MDAWEGFIKDPDNYEKNLGEVTVRPWSAEEMIRLDAFLQAGKSYDFVADKMGRSYISVERKAQTTDWKAWRALSFNEKMGEDVDHEDENKKAFMSQLVAAILTIARNDFKKLDSVTQSNFLERVNLDKKLLPCSFTELKSAAKEELVLLGYGNPE